MDKFRYLAFYKPYGVLTAFTDEDAERSGAPGDLRETLKAYIDVPGIYPAGRLDLDSEGLLLLTDDGELAHRLTDPRYNHPKTYLVQVEGTPTAQALARLESGVEVKGQQTRRAQVMQVAEPDLPARRKPVTPHGPIAWLRIVLREGKKRQIRHMTAAVGLPTLRIVRIAIGPVALADLQPGQWRDLSAAEEAALRELLRKPALADPAPRAKKQNPGGGQGRPRQGKTRTSRPA